MERCDVRHRLYVHLYSDKAPVTWIGAFDYDPGSGLTLDCRDLPLDVFQAVQSGLSHDGHWGACQLSQGRYVTYAGRQA